MFQGRFDRRALRRRLGLIAGGATLVFGGVAHAQADPFQYLEAPKAPLALTWAKARTEETRSMLSALPDHAKIAVELTSILKAHAPPPAYVLLGSKILRFAKDADRPYGVLEIADRGADGRPGPWRLVLDVGALRQRENKPYELEIYKLKGNCLAELNRCLVALSPGGGDANELRELDLATGAFVDGGFRMDVAARVQSAWLARDKVLIAAALPGEPLTKAGWAAQARLWRRGTALLASPVAAVAKSSDAVLELASVGSGSKRRGVVLRALDYSTFQLTIVDQSGRATDVALPTKLKPFGLLGATDHHLLVQLGAAATIGAASYPAETVLSYDIDAAPGVSPVEAVFTPSGGDLVNDIFSGIAATRSRAWLVVENHLRKRLVSCLHKASGWTLETGAEAEAGAGITILSADAHDDAVLVGLEGFVTPLKIDLVRPEQPDTTIYAQAPSFDASTMTVDVKTARSPDGTPVDYYLVRPIKPAHPGQTPTLITGYGAFGITLGPDYLGSTVAGPATQLWYERGGALVLPAIRGGGERGEAWHRSAMRKDRQRSYDDFIAVANDLENGFTTPAHVGVFGSSNGGLLAATVAIERPDLFAAVVSDVPLTDMLRFPEMGMGAAWEDEYGDPADPAMRTAILGYSPYHNVRPGVTYPPFLLTVSTEDQRVGPGHARKLAARLLSVGAPAHYYEDGAGGHGVSDALQRPDLMALRMAFLIDTLMSASPADHAPR